MNRVRYAPSPTGLQHLGGLRTALFNYFFARSTGGAFILRIEDTDRRRFDPAAMEDLYGILDWAGIEYDEGPDKGGEFGPYVQSGRLELYRKRVEELCERGMAYPCFCSEERLAELRSQQSLDSRNTGYDRKCREISREEANRRIHAGESHVLRLKIPLEGKVYFEDVVLGNIGKKNKDLSPDPVIMKADGYPTYHLANVVDDHEMRISHVLRAQEWLPSVPLHLHIYRAFDWEPPVFCHLPMVMDKDGSKLSKRDGSTTVSVFRREGYLPDALTNFVSLLGWSYDDRKQIFSKEEMCQLFSLEKINKAPAVFDYRKLDWFNGQYIRFSTKERLIGELKRVLIRDRIICESPTDSQINLLNEALPFIRERLKRLNDVSFLVSFLYSDPGQGNVEKSIPGKFTVGETCASLGCSMEIIEQYSVNPVSDDDLEKRFRAVADEKDWAIGDMFLPLRFALTASRTSLPIIPSIRLLGAEECRKRINRLVESLKALE